MTENPATVVETQGVETTQTQEATQAADINKLVSEQLGVDLETAKQRIEMAQKYQELEPDYAALKTKVTDYEQRVSKYEGNEFVKTFVEVTENNPEKIDAFLTLSRTNIETSKPLDVKVLRLQLEKGWDRTKAEEYINDSYNLDTYDDEAKARNEKKLKWDSEEDAKWLQNYKKEIVATKKQAVVEEPINQEEITSWINGSKEKISFDSLGKVSIEHNGFKYETELQPDQDIIQGILASLPEHAVKNKIKKDEKNLEVLKHQANLALKLSTNPIKLVENILSEVLKQHEEHMVKKFATSAPKSPATRTTGIQNTINNSQTSFVRPARKKE